MFFSLGNDFDGALSNHRRYTYDGIQMVNFHCFGNVACGSPLKVLSVTFWHPLSEALMPLFCRGYLYLHTDLSINHPVDYFSGAVHWTAGNRLNIK